MAAVQKLLVVGGNGFVGSSVCKAALARGWNVSSISSSGKPFRTSKGYQPEWASDVSWHTASALEPSSYRALLVDSTAVVHTVGVLLEAARYKEAVRKGDIPLLLTSLFGGREKNPLKRRERGEQGSYEMMNRDTALKVCETYVDASQDHPLPSRTFVYLSAEDIGRPLIPRRYIETKREAEAGIQKLCSGSDIRDVFMRPSFIYHPHLRPVSSPLAALASLSATAHEKAPSIIPTPSRILRAVSPRARSPGDLPHAMEGMATTLEVRPIHLDHVGEAICKAIEISEIRGPVSVTAMRELIGRKQS